ncbi:hypothetical protein [Saccharothrix australiensis]|uniref:hypothetical protein n=1 Tax=Saccharothrix australiensis TaxID=2072 RepID=UPI0011C36E05|nr:hypothetical protein [Saccharothrix australiensis]
MIDNPRGALPVVLQLAAVWLVAVLSFATVGFLVLLGFWARALPLVGLGMATPFVLFLLVGALTRAASPLTGTAWWRSLWALLVTALGLCGAVYYACVLEAFGPAHKPSQVLLLAGIGLPFALVAGILARGLVLPLASAAATVALIAVGATAPNALSSDTPAARVAHAGLPGGKLLVARPAGYHPPTLAVADGQAVLEYAATGPDAPLTAEARLITRATLGEGPHLAYREDPAHHVWVRRFGRMEVIAVARKEADKDAVREFALSADEATDAEVMRLLPPAPRREVDVVDRFTRLIGWLFP